MESLEERIVRIETRNRAVEADKAWETSWTRMLVIDVVTYLIVAIFLSIIQAPNALIAALVPVIGFTLSTLSIPVIKRRWNSGHD